MEQPMRCKTLTAIYRNEVKSPRTSCELDFSTHESISIHIMQSTERTIIINSTSEQSVNDLIAVLTKIERLLMLFDGCFMSLLSIEFQDSTGCVPHHLKVYAEHFMRNRLAYFHSNKILFSQLKFLYPLKTLVFPAFSPPRFGPFPSFFPLREEMRETFFRPSLQPYPVALRKFAWPLWWRGRKCSSWYLHQNVPAAPAHPWVLPREREGWSYMYASTDGSENHPYPRSSFGSIGTHC